MIPLARHGEFLFPSIIKAVGQAARKGVLHRTDLTSKCTTCRPFRNYPRQKKKPATTWLSRSAFRGPCAMFSTRGRRPLTGASIPYSPSSPKLGLVLPANGRRDQGRRKSRRHGERRNDRDCRRAQGLEEVPVYDLGTGRDGGVFRVM